MDNAKKFFCGIDIGSSATKVVLLDQNRNIVDMEAMQKGVGVDNVEKLLKNIYKRHPEISESQLICASTGYGRFSCKEASVQISEITCHAKGVFYLVPHARTIIDIGGQDSKGIRLSDRGTVEEFVMNDKCAAGTGRFLDVMSQVLGLELSKLGEVDQKSDKEIKISNTCTVFAESEVISHLAAKEKTENIVAGIHRSAASKVASLVKRLFITDTVVLTGGVAQNSGILRALSKELGKNIVTPKFPQFTGALGAAIYALEKYAL